MEKQSKFKKATGNQALLLIALVFLSTCHKPSEAQTTNTCPTNNQCPACSDSDKICDCSVFYQNSCQPTTANLTSKTSTINTAADTCCPPPINKPADHPPTDCSTIANLSDCTKYTTNCAICTAPNLPVPATAPKHTANWTDSSLNQKCINAIGNCEFNPAVCANTYASCVEVLGVPDSNVCLTLPSSSQCTNCSNALTACLLPQSATTWQTCFQAQAAESDCGWGADWIKNLAKICKPDLSWYGAGLNAQNTAVNNFMNNMCYFNYLSEIDQGSIVWGDITNGVYNFLNQYLSGYEYSDMLTAINCIAQAHGGYASNPDNGCIAPNLANYVPTAAEQQCLNTLAARPQFASSPQAMAAINPNQTTVPQSSGVVSACWGATQPMLNNAASLGQIQAFYYTQMSTDAAAKGANTLHYISDYSQLDTTKIPPPPNYETAILSYGNMPLNDGSCLPNLVGLKLTNWPGYDQATNANLPTIKDTSKEYSRILALQIGNTTCTAASSPPHCNLQSPPCGSTDGPDASDCCNCSPACLMPQEGTTPAPGALTVANVSCVCSSVQQLFAQYTQDLETTLMVSLIVVSTIATFPAMGLLEAGVTYLLTDLLIGTSLQWGIRLFSFIVVGGLFTELTYIPTEINKNNADALTMFTNYVTDAIMNPFNTLGSEVLTILKHLEPALQAALQAEMQSQAGCGTCNTQSTDCCNSSSPCAAQDPGTGDFICNNNGISCADWLRQNNCPTT